GGTGRGAHARIAARAADDRGAHTVVAGVGAGASGGRPDRAAAVGAARSDDARARRTGTAVALVDAAHIGAVGGVAEGAGDAGATRAGAEAGDVGQNNVVDPDAGEGAGAVRCGRDLDGNTVARIGGNDRGVLDPREERAGERGLAAEEGIARAHAG